MIRTMHGVGEKDGSCRAKVGCCGVWEKRDSPTAFFLRVTLLASDLRCCFFLTGPEAEGYEFKP